MRNCISPWFQRYLFRLIYAFYLWYFSHFLRVFYSLFPIPYSIGSPRLYTPLIGPVDLNFGAMRIFSGVVVVLPCRDPVGWAGGA